METASITIRYKLNGTITKASAVRVYLVAMGTPQLKYFITQEQYEQPGEIGYSIVFISNQLFT